MLLLLLLVGVAGSADELKLPSRDNVLYGLHDQHPRLLARANDFTVLRSLCE